MKSKALTLFLSMLSLSAFTFGGGYVIVPLMKRKFVDGLHWLGEDEMMDLVAIAQSSPGAVAVNASVLIGHRLMGLKGALIGVIGTVLPPLVIVSVLSVFYAQVKDNALIQAVLGGMQAGVAAVISSAVIDLGARVVRGRDALSIAVMGAVFVLTYALRVNAIYSILACAALGYARFAITNRRKAHAH